MGCALLADWGTSVTIGLTFQEQSGLNPAVSFVKPFGGNVPNPQTYALGLGASATANAQRVETIQFTYSNAARLQADMEHPYKDRSFTIPVSRTALGKLPKKGPNDVWYYKVMKDAPPCNKFQDGFLVDSNLKIGEFIYDKTIVANLHNDTSSDRRFAPFNTLTDQVAFTVSYGGNVTPVWKFIRVTADTNSTLFSATRTDTDTLVITLGPVQSQPRSIIQPNSNRQPRISTMGQWLASRSQMA